MRIAKATILSHLAFYTIGPAMMYVGLTYWADLPIVAIDQDEQCVYIEIKGERLPCGELPHKYTVVHVSR